MLSRSAVKRATAAQLTIIRSSETTDNEIYCFDNIQDCEKSGGERVSRNALVAHSRNESANGKEMRHLEHEKRMGFLIGETLWQDKR